MSVNARFQVEAIRFRLDNVTRDFKFEDARIVVSDPAKHLDATLTRKPPGPDSLAPEHGDGLISAICERSVTDRLYQQAVSSGQISMKQDAVGSVYHDMQRFILRALHLLRWRTKSPGRPHPVRAIVSFRWSLDGVEWKSVADFMSIKIKQLENPPILTEEATEFVNAEISGRTR
jgi:hypothetical protein